MDNFTLALRQNNTILIAEDEPLARRNTAEILRRGGYHVCLARSGKNAVTRVLRHAQNIGLILMDIRMPGEFDGIEAAKRIHNKYPGIPVVLVTAYSDNPDYKTRIHEAGLKIAAWVEKPFSNEERLMTIIKDQFAKLDVRSSIEKALQGHNPSHSCQSVLKQLLKIHPVELLAEIISDIIAPPIELDTRLLFPCLNFVILQTRQEELERKYPDQFVAFHKGKFVGHNRKRGDLIREVFTKNDNTDCFITQLSAKPSAEIKLRRPFRVIR